MKKFLSFLLAVVLVLAVLPATTVSANEVVAQVPYFATAPAMDGTIDRALWGEPLFLVGRDAPNMEHFPGAGSDMTPADMDDLSGYVWLGWNADTLFFAAQVTYDNHVQPALLGGDILMGNCVQIQIGGNLNPASANDGRNEIGFALQEQPPRQLHHAWMSAGTAFGTTMRANENYIVIREGNVTTYVAAMPLSTWSNSIEVLESGMQIAFSFAFTMGDEGGFYEFFDGIVRNKDITMAPFVELVGGGAPVARPPADGQTVLRFPIGSTTYTNNGVSHELEAAPFIANDRTMVPLRVIAEALGAENLAFNDGVITFNIGAQDFEMTVGVELEGFGAAPTIVEARTFVPLGFIANALDGASARWDGSVGQGVAYVYVG